MLGAKKSIINLFIISLCIVFLNACGGGSGSDKQPQASAPTLSPTPIPAPVNTLKGVFLGGEVDGIHYRTATQSGLTNTEGEYQYFNGETITFSIGNIELGSTIAKSEINPFDFFNMNAPTSRTDLEQILVQDIKLPAPRGPIVPTFPFTLRSFPYIDTLDATEKRTLNFHRVANMMFLLVSLDIDFDISNGIDLGDWDGMLQTAELSFNSSLFEFKSSIFRDFATRYGVNPNSEITTALPYLYDILGINLPMYAPASYSTDSNNDGIFEWTELYTYNSAGLLEMISSRSDGMTGLDNKYMLIYNSKGQLLEEVSRLDQNDNGVYDFVEKEYSVFDNLGRMTNSGNEFEFDAELDSNLDGVDIVTFSYDDGFRILYRHNVEDWDNDGTPNAIYDRTFAYNDDGLLLDDLQQDFDGLTGILDYSNHFANTYDTQGKRLSHLQERDSDGDGNSDYIFNVVSTFDQQGNELTESTQVDVNGDGAFESSTNTLFSYDGNGNAISQIYEQDIDGDGAINHRTITTNTWSADGLLLTGRSEVDANLDGLGDYVSTQVTYAYDSSGRQVSMVGESDHLSDGTIEIHYRLENQYSNSGELVSQIEELYIPETGNVRNQNELLIIETETGRRKTITSKTDSNNDGQFNNLIGDTVDYDSNGNIVSSEQVFELNSYAVIKAVTRRTNTYDSNMRLLSSLFEEDSDGDGAANRVTQETNTYTNDSLLKVLTIDFNNDGAIEDRYEEISMFDENGNVSSILERGSVQSNGSSSSESKKEYTYILINDGIRYLIDRER